TGDGVTPRQHSDRTSDDAAAATVLELLPPASRVCVRSLLAVQDAPAVGRRVRADASAHRRCRGVGGDGTRLLAVAVHPVGIFLAHAAARDARPRVLDDGPSLSPGRGAEARAP